MLCKDYTGQEIGYLKVKYRGPDRQFSTSKQPQWMCECVCGQEVLMTSGRLHLAKTNQECATLSCGCKNFTSVHKNTKRTPSEASFLALFLRTKNAAKKRGIEWSLTFEEFHNLVTQFCVWCGTEPLTPFNASLANNGYSQLKHPTYRMLNGKILVNGLDRIDNNQGYTIGNVQPSCKYCNFARNDRTQNEFLTWLKKLGKMYNEETQ